VLELQHLTVKAAKGFIENLEVFANTVDTSILENSFSILFTKVPP